MIGRRTAMAAGRAEAARHSQLMVRIPGVRRGAASLREERGYDLDVRTLRNLRRREEVINLQPLTYGERFFNPEREHLMTENELGTVILDAAVALHRELGPGLLESVYEVILAHALQERGLAVERQVAIRIKYRDLEFDEGFRADLVVEGRVIVELKSVERVSAAHKKQLQTYLRLSGCKLGYLLNFSAGLMKDGITRAVNGLEN